jgi:hypothetical protein
MRRLLVPVTLAFVLLLGIGSTAWAAPDVPVQGNGGTHATSITYAGSTMDADGDADTVLTAKLSCADDPSLVVGRQLDFYLGPVVADAPSPVAGLDGTPTALIGSATTGPDGTATLVWTHDPALAEEQGIIVEFASTSGLEASSTTAFVLVLSPGNEAVKGTLKGSGKYKTELGLANFNLFLTSKGSAVGPVRGNLAWGVGTTPHYEFSSVSLYGYEPIWLPGYPNAIVVRGVGTLSTFATWPSRTWPTSTVMVPFVAIACDGGVVKVGTKRINQPDYFGIDFLGREFAGDTKPMKLISGGLTIQ